MCNRCMTASDYRTGIVSCHRTMYAAAMRILNDGAEAADTVQTCMVRIWERRNSIALPEDVETGCRTVARREALNRLRRRIAEPIGDSAEPEGEERADSRLRGNDTRRHLLSLLRQLPEKQHRAAYLNFFRGLTQEETAEAMGESDANVRQLLCRARKNLRTLYDREL